MSYATTTDVQRRLRRNYETLYTRDGAIDTDVVAADIAAAEAEIDGALAQRYAVPVTSGNAELLKQWTLTLVEDLAYGAVPGREVPKNVAARVEVVRKQLAAAAEGKFSLGTTAAPTEKTAVTDAVIVEANTPEFTRTKLAGW